MQGFYFYDLAVRKLKPGRPFPGFATGAFVDMYGREVEFTVEALPDVLERTRQAIRDAQAKQMPGLPIDARQHDKGDAAGWIVGADLGTVTDSTGEEIPVMMLEAEWTKLGVELISERILTNFSPTVNLEEDNVYVMGGSLTNWPASIDKNGVPLFEAIELSQGVRKLTQLEYTGTAGETIQAPDTPADNGGNGMNKDKDKDRDVGTADLSPDAVAQMRAELMEELRSEVRQEVIEELAPSGDGDAADDAVARLRKQLKLDAFADVADLDGARRELMTGIEEALRHEYQRLQANSGKMLRDMMAEIKREQHIADMANKLTAGTEKHPRGLPVGREELEAFLGSLSEKQRAGAESILNRIWTEGLTEFGELGHGRKVQGTRQLDAPIAAQLRAAMKKGISKAEFFQAASDILGPMEEYDLSDFE